MKEQKLLKKLNKRPVSQAPGSIQPAKNKQKRRKNGGAIVPPKNPIELLNDLLNEDDDDTKSESDTLQGFKVVKYKLSQDSEAIHHLFIKRHSSAIAELSKEKPPERTLLCHNVPPYLIDSHLKEIFCNFGSIAKVYIHQKPTTSLPEKHDFIFPVEKNLTRGFKVAYIVYKKPKSVTDLLELNPDEVEPIALKTKTAGGLSQWLYQYNQIIVPTTDLENSVRKFMENFDKDEVKRKEMEKNSGEADENGWVTVTRTGKRASGGAVRSETMEERLKAKKRRQDKQLVNFTPAQMKETKMKQLMELKKKFEEDKQRVALLKQQRKFKPF